jgi:hypothetical protein
MRGPAFFAYADNYLIDVKFGVIMDAKASRAIRQAEVGAAKTMVERTEERFDIKPKWLAADTAYGSAATLILCSSYPSFSVVTYRGQPLRRPSSVAFLSLVLVDLNQGLAAGLRIP